MPPGRTKGTHALAWVALLSCSVLCALYAGAAPILRFSLDKSYTTSAGVYDSQGRLLRTLWSGRKLPAGKQTFDWDGLDDAGRPVNLERVGVRLLYHNISYRWDGVFGNTSATFTGMNVHHSMFPPTSIAIAGNRAVYAVGYNEGQVGTHGFALDKPQIDLAPLHQADPFSAWSYVAADGHRLYWANAGGISPASFVAASDLATEAFVPLPAGKSICLQYNGSNCYPHVQYFGVIDIGAEKSDAPTGLAVQAGGSILAVAHGQQGVVKLFDKTTGAYLRSFSVPASADATNQLAAAPNGDLWVIAAGSVSRYAALGSQPALAASISGLSHPLAVAVDPRNDDIVLVADGGASQQVKAFDRNGRSLWSYGVPGGYGTDPTVTFDKLWFRFDANLERTALSIQRDGSFWVVDTCNNRMLHISRDLTYIEQIAYLPRSYSATVDPGNPGRVYANYLEFEVRQTSQLKPGPDNAGKLTRNWLAGLPAQAQSPAARNGDKTGLQTVVTLSNGRSYALSAVGSGQALLELPRQGPARHIRTFQAPSRGDSPMVLYENGDLGYAHTSHLQTIYRHALTGFDRGGDPVWESPARAVGSVATRPGVPTYKGAFSGATGPRFPITSTGKLLFFDQSVNAGNGNAGEEYHLGAMDLNGEDWAWKASPPGPIDQPGAYPTQAVDKGVNYGGNMLWAVGRHLVYGYHGEGFADKQRGGMVGQANQFMHFYDNGLYIGQFGIPTTRSSNNADPGVAGNAFSNILIDSGPGLWLFHNDEGQHGGIHRWTIDNLSSLRELVGTGRPGGEISLQ